MNKSVLFWRKRKINRISNVYNCYFGGVITCFALKVPDSFRGNLAPASRQVLYNHPSVIRLGQACLTGRLDFIASMINFT